MKKKNQGGNAGWRLGELYYVLLSTIKYGVPGIH